MVLTQTREQAIPWCIRITAHFITKQRTFLHYPNVWCSESKTKFFVEMCHNVLSRQTSMDLNVGRETPHKNCKKSEVHYLKEKKEETCSSPYFPMRSRAS